jgi:hypothetical protein
MASSSPARQTVEENQPNDADDQRTHNCDDYDPKGSPPLAPALFSSFRHSKSATINLTPRRRECHAFFPNASNAEHLHDRSTRTIEYLSNFGFLFFTLRRIFDGCRLALYMWSSNVR